MKKLLLVLPLVFLLCFTFSCQQTEEVAEEEKTEQEEPKAVMALAQERQSIAEANIKFGEVFRSGDAAALANLYTEDAWLMSQTGEMFKGREGIATFWAGAFQMGMKEVVLTTVDVMRMDEKGEKAVIKYVEDCMCCDACELDCPVEAIYVSPEKYNPIMVSWC